MKKLIMPVVATILLAGGFAIAATTYTNVTPVKTQMIEAEVDGKMTITETEVVTEDLQKQIKKEWDEPREETFRPADKLRNLDDYKREINNYIGIYNDIVDELTTAKKDLSLDITVPKKLTNIE